MVCLCVFGRSTQPRAVYIRPPSLPANLPKSPQVTIFITLKFNIGALFLPMPDV